MPSDKKKTSRGRAGKPKVSTGCKTCKRRKVKCDETKPGCSRCFKFGIDCEGYGSTQSGLSTNPTKFAPAHKERFLLPNNPHLVLRRASEPLPCQARLQPVTQRKGGLEDQQYFRPRQGSLNHDLMNFNEGSLDNLLWDHRLLNTHSTPDTEPLIQQLKDSIIALSKAKSSEKSVESFSLASAHYSFAFRQYGKALEAIREVASSTAETHPTKTLLHASVLIFIFESIQGDSAMAITHLRSAYGALVIRDPSLKNCELAKLVEGIDNKSSINEIFMRLENLQAQCAPATIDPSGSVPPTFG
ncbi:hypothetical protein VTL71DRAFT_9894 [Oculimacula yallundae]|uniref:Zn(2)-C6 fungal-type domain-containing protein n=1 Tax=Oculimacula yallundae TaxID=86028 RepID=A0ABR4BQV2_9HELO